MLSGADGIARDHDLDESARWDLPSPEEFELLRDPTNLSVEAMLEVARHARFYNERLVETWVHSSAMTLHGGSFRPGQGRKIIDGLAAIDDVVLATMAAADCNATSSYREDWLHSADDHVDRLVQDGLCAPLCWRVPPRAFIDLSQDHRMGPPPAFYALRRLARFMGLDYDPDAVFRREAPKLVGDDADIYPLAEAFRARELQFEWSTDPIPLPPPPEGFTPASKLRPRPPGYHGHLGSYTPATGRIVLAAPTIDSVAQSIGRAPRHIGSVTLLHLSVLGLLHNGIDLDGQRWESFSTGDPSPWTGGVPPVIIVLAQLFVHRFLVELDDDHLLDAFEALTDSQPPEYGVWRAMTHVSLEAGRAWMISIRRGTGGPAPIDLDALLRPR